MFDAASADKTDSLLLQLSPEEAVELVTHIIRMFVTAPSENVQLSLDGQLVNLEAECPALISRLLEMQDSSLLLTAEIKEAIREVLAVLNVPSEETDSLATLVVKLALFSLEWR